MDDRDGIAAGQLTADDLEAVESEIGMGYRAWDMVDPRELMIACHYVVAKKLLALAGSVLTAWA